MKKQIYSSPLQIWGGVECTIVRVNNNVYDQLDISGHEKRLSDLQLFADLGIKTIRYPMLWEKYALDKDAFFKLHYERLSKLKVLGITPIAGLMHHGSGPFFTSLNDEKFPDILAEYAFDLSSHFPELKYYTPVNEPLTTARFSGLYGLWYPHLRCDNSFIRILLNELKGIILAMKAVKANNSSAELIQTEDISKIHSTPILSYQSDFENNRRWLTYDILTGKFDAQHPLWQYFLNSGIKEEELYFFMSNKTEPAICGFNYYISSERYLDHDISKYPVQFHGGNGIHKYADIEAVRISGINVDLYSLISEAYRRFKLPVALTEVHLSCTREEQMRWFKEAYETGIKLRNDNIDFRAITTWSFLGSFGWSTLLTGKNMEYESGAFDIRSGTPRPTALAKMIKDLNNDGNYNDMLLEVPGWWRRNVRNIFESDYSENDGKILHNIPPILILGATGSLGKAFARICNIRGLAYELLNREQLEITSRQTIEKILDIKKPWAIINATGFTRIDEAEKNPQVCFRVNTLGPSILADVCESNNIKLAIFSSDQVFNGKKRNPYIESDRPEPVNVYGESKRKADDIVRKINPKTLIIRSCSIFSPWSENDLLIRLINSETTGVNFYLPDDVIISPAYIVHIVNATLDLLIDNETGIWHLSNENEISYFDFARMALNMAGLSNRHIHPVHLENLKYIAQRPKYSVLSNSKGISLPPLESALSHYFNELQSDKRLNEVSPVMYNF